MTPTPPYGPMTIERYRLFENRYRLGVRVLVRGEDVTQRCRYADDTPGRQVAVLYRKNDRGCCYLDEDGQPSVEIAEGDEVVMVPPSQIEP
jgi:hypothetical protein